jgi:hypothetical protein
VAGPAPVALFAATFEWAFFCAQWEEHYTHVLRTSIGDVFGVTEIHYTLITLQLVTAVCGIGVWDTTLPEAFPLVGGWTLMKIMGMLGLASLPFGLCSAFVNVYKTVGVGEMVPALKSVAPMLVLSGLMAVLTAGPFAGLVAFSTAHPLLVITVCGILSTHVANRMIIASVTRSDASAIEHKVVFHGCAAVVVAMVVAPALGIDAVVPFAIFGWEVVKQYLDFVVAVAVQIADHLNIYVFRLGKKQPVAAQ